jgi:hypothetical protein
VNWSQDQIEWVIFTRCPFHSEESLFPLPFTRLGASLGVVTGIEPNHVSLCPITLSWLILGAGTGIQVSWCRRSLFLDTGRLMRSAGDGSV